MTPIPAPTGSRYRIYQQLEAIEQSAHEDYQRVMQLAEAESTGDSEADVFHAMAVLASNAAASACERATTAAAHLKACTEQRPEAMPPSSSGGSTGYRYADDGCEPPQAFRQCSPGLTSRAIRQPRRNTVCCRCGGNPNMAAEDSDHSAATTIDYAHYYGNGDASSTNPATEEQPEPQTNGTNRSQPPRSTGVPPTSTTTTSTTTGTHDASGQPAECTANEDIADEDGADAHACGSSHSGPQDASESEPATPAALPGSLTATDDQPGTETVTSVAGQAAAITEVGVEASNANDDAHSTVDSSQIEVHDASPPFTPTVIDDPPYAATATDNSGTETETQEEVSPQVNTHMMQQV